MILKVGHRPIDVAAGSVRNDLMAEQFQERKIDGPVAEQQQEGERSVGQIPAGANHAAHADEAADADRDKGPRCVRIVVDGTVAAGTPEAGAFRRHVESGTGWPKATWYAAPSGVGGTGRTTRRRKLIRGRIGFDIGGAPRFPALYRDRVCVTAASNSQAGEQ